MEEAKKGNITEEMKAVARSEGLSPEKIRRLVAEGRVVIPRNVKRETTPKGIGRMMSTKINANVGTSRDYVCLDEEIEKAEIAEKYGADAIMDLSTGGDLDFIRKQLINHVSVPFGTVPIYQAAMEKEAVVNMTSDDMFNVIRKHARDGVDFMTIHAGVNLNSLERLKKSDRILDVVSRGGAFTIGWMLHNGEDNPYYKEFDYLLEIMKEYDVTISLGDGMRPGCLHDASDRGKFMEFITLGELVKEAREAGVQSMVEGPGHVPLDEIGLSVDAMKKLTGDAPLYLLGPLVTDIAPGYDHIVGAIGSSIAGMHGADFICMVTPSEHLALPTVEQIKEGVIITKIAAHVADTVREGQREKARELDRQMAIARKELDWEKQFALAIDRERAEAIWKSRKSKSKACSMCGELCAIQMVKSALKKT
jgi:phosphomethylpyrimidine synthase